MSSASMSREERFDTLNLLLGICCFILCDMALCLQGKIGTSSEESILWVKHNWFVIRNFNYEPGLTGSSKRT